MWNSTDGINWTLVTGSAAFGPRVGHTMTVFNNRMWVIGGGSSGTADVWSSADGITWTEATANAGFAPRFDHQAFVLNNELCIVAGNAGGVGGIRLNDAWCSADGANWRLAYNAPIQFP